MWADGCEPAESFWGRLHAKQPRGVHIFIARKAKLHRFFEPSPSTSVGWVSPAGTDHGCKHQEHLEPKQRRRQQQLQPTWGMNIPPLGCPALIFHSQGAKCSLEGGRALGAVGKGYHARQRLRYPGGPNHSSALAGGRDSPG